MVDKIDEISHNFAAEYGGGIDNESNSNPILTNVQITNNTCDGWEVECIILALPLCSST